jgi:3-deoxy-manno-octulosonate cytidylyltransferase (CMP-KDO synthetase)
MQVLGVIPARYGSTRFPGKPLADIAGKSLVQRVWEQTSQAASLTACVVATEDQRIIDHVAGFGGAGRMTSAEHASGTDRLGEIARDTNYDYYVNIQGDEPLVLPAAIDALVTQTLAARTPMSTLITPFPLDHPEELANPNAVKVVLDGANCALYFSRSQIPFPRNPAPAVYFKHIGIYMYSRETLLRLCELPRTMLEDAESLEQLRALYHGVKILCVETVYDPVAVDVPGDIERVLARLK